MGEATHSGQAARVEQTGHLAGKYLTFRLGNESYGVAILKVQEIIGRMSITHVPRTPDYVRGVINLRGKVIPVIELRKKFGMEPVEDNERTCIIVMQVQTSEQSMVIAMLVDEVSEVAGIAAEQIEPTPSFGTNIHTEYILAMGKVGDSVVILLDADRVLTVSELKVVTAAGTSGT